MLQRRWLQFRQLQRLEIVASVTTSMLCSPREMPPYSKTNCRTGTLAGIHLIEKTATSAVRKKPKADILQLLLSNLGQPGVGANIRRVFLRHESAEKKINIMNAA
jgi:hypothetical protein